ncbi:MAG: NUDIX domain-containing protein [Candidatus Bathyarchaeia archaeon]
MRRKKSIEWMPDGLWNQVKRYIPIPCVDVIVEDSKGRVLLGWRQIPPYRNVWALPGGRIGKGERLQTAARRILAEYGLSARDLFLVGVFPIRFPLRSDLPVCIAAKHLKGQARADGSEFSNFRWTRQLPRALGANYRRMIARWNKMKRDPQVLQFNRL